MKKLLREDILRKTCETARKITEKEFCFETDTVIYETERAITECILFMFLIKIFGAEEEDINISQNKIIDYCITQIMDRDIHPVLVLTFINELFKKNILIRKKRSGRFYYSFNKLYLEGITNDKKN